MHFLYPSFLWALSLLAIPVLIHLFNFRRYKKVAFTNVRFIKQITEETTSRSKLKHLLVLLCRMLAVAALVLAFAQPYIPVTNRLPAEPSGLISVYVDNSFSMELTGRQNSKMEEAKKAAEEVIMAFKPSDRFQVMTNDFEGRHQRIVNREEAINLIREIKISPAARTLSEVISRQQQAADNRFTSYFISDMQTWQTNLQDLKEDSVHRLVLVPMEGSHASNLSVDTCFFSEPFILKNKPAVVKTVVRNFSNSDIEQLSVRLMVNGNQKALTSLSLPAGAAAEAELVFTPDFSGIASGEIQITDHPLTFDDRWFFSVKVFEKINTLLLSPQTANRFINAAFASDPLFNLTYQSEKWMDYGSFRSFSAIVVSDFESISSGMAAELETYLRNGGVVILFPDTMVNLDSYNTFFRTTISDTWEPPVTAEWRADKLNFESQTLSGIFDLKNQRDRNVDYPLVKKFFRTLTTSSGIRESILTLQEGSPLLSCYSVGKGKLYLATQAASPAAGNLVNHALFAPMMYRMSLHTGSVNPPFQIIGAEGNYLLTEAPVQGDRVYKLSDRTAGMEVIPPLITADGTTALNLKGIIKEAGNYELKAEDRVVDVIAFNFDRRESEPDFADLPTLEQSASKSLFRNISVLHATPKGYTAAITAQTAGKQLWKWFVVLVLLFLAAETALLRWMR
jgi:hypothetical protein